MPLLVSAVMLACAGAASAQRYQMNILQMPPEYRGVTFVWGMNNQGDVVGSGVKFGPFSDYPLLWRGGRFVELPPLDPTQEYRFSFAQGINDQGQVVGFSNGPIWGQYAVCWPDDETIINLIDRDSTAQDINDAGVIIGDYAVQVFSYKPFIWENGTWSPLWPAMAYAYDINNHNQIAGDDGHNAVIWEKGNVTYLPALVEGAGAIAGWITDLGQVVGSSGKLTNGRDSFPTLWIDGVVRELPVLGNMPLGAAFSINLRGEIVGTFAVSPYETQPALWRHNLGMNLNDLAIKPHSAWRFSQTAVWINDSGQIALKGHANALTPSQAVVLDPVDIGLTLWGIKPSRPGQRNTIQVNHATPGGRVILLWGTTRGEAQPFEPCSGAMIDLTDPHLAATAIAGPDGVAQFRLNVPANVDGQTFILQVVDHTTCEVSPPAWALFKMEN